jgi:hypothetical protein
MTIQLTCPISILNVDSFGIELDFFKSQTQSYFSDFTWDNYSFRQAQINLLSNSNAVKKKRSISIMITGITTIMTRKTEK